MRRNKATSFKKHFRMNQLQLQPRGRPRSGTFAPGARPISQILSMKAHFMESCSTEQCLPLVSESISLPCCMTLEDSKDSNVLGQIWRFYEAAVVLPLNDAVISSVLHTRANRERAHQSSRFICVVSAATSILS